MFAALQSFPPPRQSARGRRWTWWYGLALVGVSTLVLHAEVSKEYQLKAAFLYNFTKFVEWPAASFANETSPIVIGVLGENPFGDELERLVKDRKVSGREIVVKTISSVTEARAVHVLFITALSEKSTGADMARLHAPGVLTVGESTQVAASGAIINFTRTLSPVRVKLMMAPLAATWVDSPTVSTPGA